MALGVLSSVEFFEGRAQVDGLKAFKINKLRQVVVFAGKNGAGKTRILKAISEAVNEYISSISRDRDYLELVKSLKQEVFSFENPDKSVSLFPKRASDGADIGLHNSYKQAKSKLAFMVDFGLHSIRFHDLRVVNVDSAREVHFKDPNTLSPQEKKQIANAKFGNIEFDTDSSNTLVLIEECFLNWKKATHPASQIEEIPRNEMIRRFDILQRNTEILAGVKISHGLDLEPLIDGLPLFVGAGRLSNGQKKLLHFSVVYSMTTKSDDAVIFIIDEPEAFIHPESANGLIDALIKTYPNSQIFIATHSVPLIAHLGTENTWIVDEGRAEYAGKNVLSVFGSLLGGDEQIQKLRSLTLEPARLASLTFAVECLQPPRVLGLIKNDPQVGQIKNALLDIQNSSKRKIKVLDFGCGKARLLSTYIADFGNLVDFDYYGYDPNPNNADAAKEEIGNVYGTHDKRFFSEFSIIEERVGSKCFDVVVICNVVHEINPIDWPSTFQGISRLLSRDGFLIIVEDKQIPIGELAHQAGFLIPDANAIRILFKMTESPKVIDPSSSKYTGRLEAIIVPSRFLGKHCDLYKAIKYLRDNSLKKVKEIRSRQNSDYNTGINHALYSQQHANASIILQTLKPNLYE